MNDLLLKDARLITGEVVSIAIKDGKIAAIGAIEAEADEVYPLAYRVVMPGFIDSHVHLDKTFTLPFSRAAESLHEAIELWRGIRGDFCGTNYGSRALRAVMIASHHGTTAMRTHVDVSPDVGLVALEAMLELKERVKSRMDIQIVAMGRYGVTREEDEMMRAALEAGADIIGGAPLLTPEPIRCLKKMLDLAERYEKPVDLHIDESEARTGLLLDILTLDIEVRGLPEGYVTASHCVSLASLSQGMAEYVIGGIQRAGVNVITLPSCNLVLQGRQSGKRGVTRVRELLEAGVNVATASDNVQDCFNPFGNYDLLWQANLTAHAAHMTSAVERQEALRMITDRPAKIMGLENYGLKKGCDADLVVLDTPDHENILAFMPPRWLVLKRGVPVVESQGAIVDREWAKETRYAEPID